MKQIITQIKPYLRWFVLGGVVFFLIKTLKDRFAEVAAICIDGQGWLLLASTLLLTIAAHVWSGYVWTWIIKLFEQPLKTQAGIKVYLLTNIAKYSPGNIWHFYGRISAIASRGGSKRAATLCVLLEPLLMAAAALLIALFSNALSSYNNSYSNLLWLQILSLLLIFIGIHPQILNPLLHRLSRSKSKSKSKSKNQADLSAASIELTQYPIKPFLGEIGFVIVRAIGFIFTFWALQPVIWQQVPQLTGAFSFAWLLGLVVPGAPGGLGVFEVTAYGLLDDAGFPTEIAAVALYRLISILAEVIAAAVSWKLAPQS